jgi:porphobilinogen synthase
MNISTAQEEKRNSISTHSISSSSYVETMQKRPRRNRKNPALRDLVRETKLHATDFIAPFFVQEGQEKTSEISSLPGIFRYSIDSLLREIESYMKLGVRGALLFPVVNRNLKDPVGSEACNPNALLPRAIKAVKKHFPELLLSVDVALDPYTSHGHDGVINEAGIVQNDPTLERLAASALIFAEAGVDVIAPSDMMDGRIGFIRKVLDKNNFYDVNILAYTAKYASACYGPFRDALSSSLSMGDKKNYQMDPANAREALVEATLDEEEGADMLMVKPALFYLDIIRDMRKQTNLPIAAYHVSGEYAMIKAAHEKGWIHGPDVLYEALTAIKRAGADIMITYGIKEIADRLN